MNYTEKEIKNMRSLGLKSVKGFFSSPDDYHKCWVREVCNGTFIVKPHNFSSLEYKEWQNCNTQDIIF